MNADIKELWIKALKSGDYHQDTGALRTNNGFCCLGVLCDLHRQTNKKKFGWKKDFQLGWFFYNGEGEILPQDVIEWAGLKSGDPVCNNTALSHYNDSGTSFSDIADIIKTDL